MIAIVAVLVLAIGVPAAFAMGHGFRHAASGAQVAYATSSANGIGQKLASVQGALATEGAAGNSASSTACPGFTDADDDGVCDKCDKHHAACSQYADTDGNGYCDACGRHHGACSGYVDSDNDGVCDNHAVDHQSCSNYVDADGDGVCDSRGTRSAAGAGGQAGHHGQAHGHHNGYHHGCK